VVPPNSGGHVEELVYFNTIADELEWRVEPSLSSFSGFRKYAHDPWLRTGGHWRGRAPQAGL
jgi:hypothetical protein